MELLKHLLVFDGESLLWTPSSGWYTACRGDITPAGHKSTAERSAAPLLEQGNIHISQYFRQQIADSWVQLRACLHLKLIINKKESRERLQKCRPPWVIILRWTNHVPEIVKFLWKFNIYQKSLLKVKAIIIMNQNHFGYNGKRIQTTANHCTTPPSQPYTPPSGSHPSGSLTEQIKGPPVSSNARKKKNQHFISIPEHAWSQAAVLQPVPRSH